MEILVKFSGCIVRLLALKLHLSQSEICIPKYAFGKKKKKNLDAALGYAGMNVDECF